MQVLPLQQPVGQLAGLQTHAPPTQRWPVPHAGLAPHLHPPPLQLSARVASQVEHAAPEAPHLEIVGVTQAPASQHPFGQLVASQAQLPPTQR